MITNNHHYRKKLLIIIAVISFLITEIIGAETTRPIVTNITVQNTGKGTILISWKNPANIGSYKIQLYRTEKPVALFTDLTQKDLLADLPENTTSYTDKIKNYSEYYYTIIVNKNNKPYTLILPSLNATVSGIKIKYLTPENTTVNKKNSVKEKVYPKGTMREVPLPILDLIETNTTPDIEMSKESFQNAQKLSNNYYNIQTRPLDPYFFDSDMISSSSGDDYLLFKILHETFALKNYTDSKIRLTNFLAIKRNPNTSNRAKFYLAESDYYLGNYQEAVSYFTMLIKQYPELAKKWINASLDLMKLPQNNNFNKYSGSSQSK